MSAPLDDGKSISVKEVSELTGFSVRIVQKYAREGIIPGAFQPRPGPRAHWWFKREPLEKWWREQGA